MTVAWSWIPTLSSEPCARLLFEKTFCSPAPIAAGTLGTGRHTDPVGEAERFDPLAWFTDVLERIVSGRTKRHELDTLLPWNWKAAKATETYDTT